MPGNVSNPLMLKINLTLNLKLLQRFIHRALLTKQINYIRNFWKKVLEALQIIEYIKT